MSRTWVRMEQIISLDSYLHALCKRFGQYQISKTSMQNFICKCLKQTDRHSDGQRMNEQTVIRQTVYTARGGGGGFGDIYLVCKIILPTAKYNLPS